MSKTQDLDLNSLFEYSDGKLFWKNCSRKHLNGKEAGTFDGRYWKVGLPNGKKEKRARIVYKMFNGEFSELCVDHINGDKTDDRIENLRLATLSQNNSNTVRKSRIGMYPCVEKRGNKFIVDTQYEGKRYKFYGFNTAESAYQFYVDFSKKHKQGFYVSSDRLLNI
jgi:hypothetical protein